MLADLTARTTWYKLVRPTKKLTLQRLQFLGMMTRDQRAQMKPVAARAPDWVILNLSTGRSKSLILATTRPCNNNTAECTQILKHTICLIFYAHQNKSCLIIIKFWTTNNPYILGQDENETPNYIKSCFRLGQGPPYSVCLPKRVWQHYQSRSTFNS